MERDRGPSPLAEPDSPAAWRRLWLSVLIGTIGGVGMWSMPVLLPPVQADFGIARGEASLPYTLTMMGFAFGGVAMGRLADRFGVMVPIALGAVSLGLGYVLSGIVPNILFYSLTHLLIGLGASGCFGPIMTDMSHWFVRRRGIAVGLAACGNYVAGTIWPPLLQFAIEAHGWRATQIGVGLFCVITMLPLSLLLRQRAPRSEAGFVAGRGGELMRTLGLSPYALMLLLCLAGLACCMAMAMPQVHIVAYCGDLGYGPARGAEMLSAMMGFGIVSRILWGVLADRVGGMAALLIGSALQAAALFLYLLFDGLVSLYLISALFGLFQGGIVPMYAIIVRQYFSPNEVGVRVGIVLMATLFGMALGGWMSGVIFDYTGSYQAAFLHGLAWNAVNMLIVLWLLLRPNRRMATA